MDSVEENLWKGNLTLECVESTKFHWVVGNAAVDSVAENLIVAIAGQHRNVAMSAAVEIQTLLSLHPDI